MRLTSVYFDIISGRGGIWVAPVRWVLRLVSLGYSFVVVRRNRRFETGVREVVRVSVPVISVGNITTGGTGKTPLVMWIVRGLIEMGHQPAVVARGYRGVGGAADELAMVSRRVPGVTCVGDPDRVAGARSAMEAGADCVVLDDGFQHRRIGRDLDIVVIDATNPFGYDEVLPRGLLREPLAGLKRADLLVVSRVDLVSADALERLGERLEVLAPGVPRVRCRHAGVAMRDIEGGDVEDEDVGSCRRAVLFAGIGNPGAFEATVRQMGIIPVAKVWFEDHHAYVARDLERVAVVASGVEHDCVLTTEKDAVKLVRLQADGVIEHLRVLAVDLEFLDDGADILDAAVQRVLNRDRRADV